MSRRAHDSEANGTPAVRESYLSFGQPSFTDAEIAAVSRVLRSGWVGMGPETLAFEEELARFVGAEHVVSVNSCTSALFLSLLVAGVEAGDEVICPSLTWCSTAHAALFLGARPIFCDISPATLCATARDVEAKLSNKTKAVVAVHYGGLAADVAAIRDVLPPNVMLIEDAAHALGAQYADGAPVGSKANPTCFSFYANKNLSTADGGAIAVHDAALAERLRQLRHLGLPADAWDRFQRGSGYSHAGPSELGFKMNFTDLLAAIGRVQLARFDEMQQRRRRVSTRYLERLGAAGIDIKFQQDFASPRHAKHLAAIIFPGLCTGPSRDDILRELRARNIGVSLHYPPLHNMDFYGLAGDRLPETEDIGERILTLPISAVMEPEDADYVADHLISILS